MDALAGLAGLATAPVQPWDALICTSTAVRDSVARLWQDQADYLALRLGARTPEPPRLPMIPLGVDCDAFAGLEPHRAPWRQRLGIGPDDMAVLFVGRLSFHAKAHPLAMYLALEAAARETGRRLHLIQAGWFSNESIAEAFKAGARDCCPSVTAHFLDGREPEVRSRIWAAADIFTSLSDNIQETFGLTPVEAMAAGLPLVVTDWDGYRDTVRDGVDGFRVPTMQPPEGLGSDIALRHESGVDSYDLYCGLASQLVAVDVAAATAAFARLIRDADLRRRLGAAGRDRARTVYDWAVVIRQYQTLWAELAELRGRAAESAPRAPGTPANPARPDPFRLFAGYPTARLVWETAVRRGAGADTARLRALLAGPLHGFVTRLLPEADLVRTLERVPSDWATAAAVLADLPPARRAHALRMLAFLAKAGLVELGPPGP